MKTNQLLVIFILALILFDTFQENYFLVNFAPEWKQKPFIIVLQANLIHWSFWGMMAIPLGIVVWNIENKSSDAMSWNNILITVTLIFICILTANFLTTVIVLVLQDLVEDISIIRKFFTFYLYQKGLSFFIAYSALTWLLQSEIRSRVIASQWQNISLLQKSKNELIQTLELSKSGEEPVINIKTGNRIETIEIRGIIWIQSDDYCVKVHTKDNNAYSLRKSMKSLENSLGPLGFVRVHRTVLLNSRFIEQLDLARSTVRLKGISDLPVSKVGARLLSHKMKELSM